LPGNKMIGNKVSMNVSLESLTTTAGGITAYICHINDDR
jgi:hypothetical protein